MLPGHGDWKCHVLTTVSIGNRWIIYTVDISNFLDLTANLKSQSVGVFSLIRSVFFRANVRQNRILFEPVLVGPATFKETVEDRLGPDASAELSEILLVGVKARQVFEADLSDPNDMIGNALPKHQNYANFVRLRLGLHQGSVRIAGNV